jgi:hypothetical protein
MPGFDDLYATWSEIFTPEEDGLHAINAAQAIDMWRSIQEAVKEKHNLSSGQVNHLSQIACKYAMKLPLELELEIRDM